MPRAALAILVSSLVLFSSQACVAQAGFAPENDVIATTPQFPDVSGIATDSEGDSLVVWDQTPAPKAPEEAKARWLSASGDLGPIIDLSLPAEGRAYQPQVAMAPAGRAFVAWRVLGSSGPPSAAVGRWVEADGSLGPLLTLAAGEAGEMDVVELKVVVDHAGVATAVWENQAKTKLCLRRVQPDGTLGTLLPELAGGVDGLELAALPNGSTVAAWRAAGTEVTVVTNELSYGSPQVVSSNNETADPALAIDSLGNVLVAWKEGSEGPFSVEGALLSPSGVPVGGQLLIDPSLPNNLGSEVDVAADSANDFLVTWVRQDAMSQYVVNARGVNSDGTFAGPAQPVSAGGVTGLSPRAALNDTGSGAVAWSSYVGMSSHALGRTTDAAGAPTGDIAHLYGPGNRGIDVSGAPGLGFAAFLIARSDGADVRRYMEPPSCSDSQATVRQGKPIVVPLACTGLAIESAQVTAGPGHGQLGTFDPATLSLSYSPKPGFDGNDAFGFMGVNDGGSSNVATVTIDVGKDSVKPKIKRFRFVKRKRHMKFVLKISEPARVRIVVARKAKKGKKGKRVGKLRSRKPKRKAVIKVRGKLARKLLAGGRFRATAIATDPAGNKSAPRRLKIKLPG